jgi:hypothetical protein
MVLVCMACHLTVLTNSISCEGKYPAHSSRSEVYPLKPSSYYIPPGLSLFLTFHTHSVFLYFVYTWEQVAIISLSRLK